MASDKAPATPAAVITREALRDGTLAAAFRRNAPPGYKVRNQAELDASLEQTLAGRDPRDDVRVFGYGSLMWNPAFEHTESAKAHVHGWSRRFCLRMFMGRGSVEQPGLMLALDRGGSCYGMSFRIAAAQVREELRLLWRREMLSGAYHARWVEARIGGERVPALTFVANRAHQRYTGALPIEQITRMLAQGQGTLGTCREYFEATHEKLLALGVRDAAIERIRRALASGVHAAASEAAEAAGTGSADTDTRERR